MYAKLIEVKMAGSEVEAKFEADFKISKSYVV